MASVTIVAECGASHQGSFQKAKELACMAREAGADGVKWQMWLNLDAFVGPRYAYREHFAQASLMQREWPRLFDYCRAQGIDPFATPFDLESVDLLENLGVSRYKIASGDLTYTPLLKRLGEIGKPVYLSTGMGDVCEIQTALGWLDPCDVTLLACTVAYPAFPDQAHLQRLLTLKANFPGGPVGYSDHTATGIASLGAVALGATVIEKHVGLMSGADGTSSYEDFASLVRRIRLMSLALGEADLKTYPCEERWKPLARRDPETWRRE